MGYHTGSIPKDANTLPSLYIFNYNANFLRASRPFSGMLAF